MRGELIRDFLSICGSFPTETLASYSYSLDRVGNRRSLTETVEAILDLPNGAALESGGLVVIEAEHFSNRYNGPVHQWLLKTNQSGIPCMPAGRLPTVPG
jgi:hypothetical protein